MLIESDASQHAGNALGSRAGVAQRIGRTLKISFVSQIAMTGDQDAGDLLELSGGDRLLHAGQRRVVESGRSRIGGWPAVGPGFGCEVVLLVLRLRGGDQTRQNDG